jgi:hypothetical protein
MMCLHRLALAINNSLIMELVDEVLKLFQLVYLLSKVHIEHLPPLRILEELLPINLKELLLLLDLLQLIVLPLSVTRFFEHIGSLASVV